MPASRIIAAIASAAVLAPASSAAARTPTTSTTTTTTITVTVTESSATTADIVPPTTTTSTTSSTTRTSTRTSTGTATGTQPKPKPKPTTRSGPHYVNPFADPRWEPGRIDMGMDWAPLRRLPVLAVGDAVILGSSNHSGWPAGHFIFYELTDGPLAGDVIYVAEHLTKLLPAGRHVRAGQQIAVAVPGYPYIEMGWADAYGNTRAYPCYREGVPTNSGREMAQFLGSLGANIGVTVHGVVGRPSGKRC